MNSLFGRSRVVATALSGIALAACNAVQDVRQEPTTPVPAQQSVLGGTVTGLGTRRPVILENNGANAQPFFGISGQNTALFTFGSQSVGTAYNITVRTQPYGKICTVNNGTGTLGDANAAPITVVCTNDPSVARYAVKVTVKAAANIIPNLKVRLTTEEGVVEMPGTGANADTVVTFPDVLFNAGASPPVFLYYVSAYTPDADGVSVDNCAVSAATNDNGTGTSASGASPTADVTTPQVTACTFTIGGSVGYSALPSPNVYSTQTISGLQLGLKDMTGTTANSNIYTVPDAVITTNTTTVPFTFSTVTGGVTKPIQYVANPKALYELYVVQQPTSGQYCIVTNIPATQPLINGNGSIVNLATTASIATAFANIANMAVRCRAKPGTSANPGAALTGVYQTTGFTSTATTGTAPNLSVTTVTAGTSNPGGAGTTTVTSVTTTTNGVQTTNTATQTLATQQDDRRFLSLFDDGTFLYGDHSSASFNSVLNNNLEHGFYYYNASAGTIAFTIITDANNLLSGTTVSHGGLSAVPGYASTVATATSVSKSDTANDNATGARHTLTMTFCATTPTNSCPPNPASSIQVWSMTEPNQVPGTLTGAWVSPDHEQLFVYDFTSTAGFHIGANGQDNMQDGCYVYDDPTVSSGYYVRRGGGTALDPDTLQTNCNLGANLATASSPDLPNTASVPALITGFIGRLPGSKSVIDGRPPSPTNFVITIGTPDTLVIQNTLNGTLIDYPFPFVRAQIN